MSSCGHKIKVVCRVRPFLKSERPDESVGVEPNSVLRVTNPRDTTKDIKFNFDACYGAVVGQDTIYKNDVRPLVETIFNGMSATVFCYGVTGAGKTHTIQGTEAEPGIIPRALEHIFMHQQRDAYDYDIRISYYEIYKEAVYDLLRPRDSVTPLPIREDAHRKIFVAGLSEKKVTSYEQFDALYQRACGNRSTASTKLNNHSSRSHAILTVQVQWKDDVGAGKMWCGKLHLIDLAGSEDNRRTENGKDRMAESSAINRSLFVLGQVVEALNTGSSRIPYRDSKMTRILQDSLGGESLGMMIVNVAPGEAFLQDTHNTLNFATKSREVVNKPVAHEVVEQRWTVSDRLQHHRGMGRPNRPGMVVASSAPAQGASGVKRRRSDESMVSEEEGSPGLDERTSSGGRPAVRRRISPATSATRHSDANGTANPAAGRAASHANGRRAAPKQADLVTKVVSAKFHEIEQKTESASNEIMERVMRIEKQLIGKQLDSNMVIDLFTPATKLKTSRGWLKYARELEQKGELEKALVHYEEALRYAPELNKLEAHIGKLRARIRRAKRRSSIATHGAANVKVATKPSNELSAAAGLAGGANGDGEEEGEDDEDAGPLWMVDGLAESPGAEKAKRRMCAQAAVAAGGTRPKPLSLPAHKPLVFGKEAIAPAPAPAATALSQRAPLATSGASAAGAAKGQARRVKLGADGINGKRISTTDGSVHDRRVSFGGSALNPFVVGGEDFNSDLHQRLERKVPVGALKTKKLEAKSSAVARLRQTLQAPVTPDDRSDKDFVLRSDGSDSDEAMEEEELFKQLSSKSNCGAKGRRAGRVPGSLGVRGLLVERRKAEEEATSKRLSDQAVGLSAKENLAASGNAPKPKRASSSSSSGPAAEEKLSLSQFNDICLASALQMINSAEVKKIMKLQGIGKRRAEQIQESVQTQGPISHISELQDRLQFKNKIILGILSTFA